MNFSLHILCYHLYSLHNLLQINGFHLIRYILFNNVLQCGGNFHTCYLGEGQFDANMWLFYKYS